jgi:UDP-N-acetylglucosamine acyltransferase
MPIHQTAVVSAAAEIHPEADIGPYVVIDGHVRIGARTRVMPHTFLTGWTEIGEDNVIHPGAVIGHEPQDLKFGGGESYLRIGDRNVFREYSQVHRGTTPGTATVLGDDNYLMQNAHVAHNCEIGNHVVIAGGALVAGYAKVDDSAFISGNCVVHQHVRIGRLAIMRGLSRTSRDVPPFAVMDGTHTVRTVNLVGLRRAGFSRERIRAIRAAFRILFAGPTNMTAAVARVEADGPVTADVAYLLEFIRSSSRGVATGVRRTATGAESGDDGGDAPD